MTVDNKAKTLSFSATPDLINVLDTYCSKRGCSRSWFVTTAIKKYLTKCIEDIEDKEDYETAIAALAEFEKGDKKTYSLDEVRMELGL